jgi:hypothetical protein
MKERRKEKKEGRRERREGEREGRREEERRGDRKREREKEREREPAMLTFGPLVPYVPGMPKPRYSAAPLQCCSQPREHLFLLLSYRSHPFFPCQRSS